MVVEVDSDVWKTKLLGWRSAGVETRVSLHCIFAGGRGILGLCLGSSHPFIVILSDFHWLFFASIKGLCRAVKSSWSSVPSIFAFPQVIRMATQDIQIHFFPLM
ncbi:hypothetical protein BCY86_06420 [Pajaroellobacter abortibovis]|uniref:Uncharacterized protein n=1 Tax=Pajaroellobacter abortibovis TaxID=1882918 RepID=A0A1L6MXY3_9BACT|nr:hypothetical protein BCY86_06420 [Pajaroellobacter abortibovis]